MSLLFGVLGGVAGIWLGARLTRDDFVEASRQLRKGHFRRGDAARKTEGMKKLLALLTVLGALTAAASASGSGAGSIVVSQLFAAGGNSGASYTNDYVELFNRGTSAVSITGWTLQYASAAERVWASTALTGSIPAGGHYLVQLASAERTDPRSRRPTRPARRTSRCRAARFSRQRGLERRRPRRLGLGHALRRHRRSSGARPRRRR